MSATGESDLKTYYDGIRKRQVQDMVVTVTVIYRLIAQSLKFKVGDGFGVSFRSLWQMTPEQRVAAMRRGDLTYEQLAAWSARHPDEVPTVHGEFEWIVAKLAEACE